jgi:hypothetical protein
MLAVFLVLTPLSTIFQLWRIIWRSVVLVFNDTFNNVSGITWRSVLFVKETRVYIWQLVTVLSTQVHCLTGNKLTNLQVSLNTNTTDRHIIRHSWNIVDSGVNTKKTASMLYVIPDTLLEVSLSTNKTGHHVLCYNWHIVESGVKHQ